MKGPKPKLTIWVDADACPTPIRDLLCRAAERREVPLVFVANRLVATPRSPLIRSVQVGSSFDAADREIEQRVTTGDLVITADIPLAASVVERGATALSPRGELFTDANVGDKLATRNLMDELRTAGEVSGGPAEFSAKDRQAFANRLDTFLTRALRS